MWDVTVPDSDLILEQDLTKVVKHLEVTTAEDEPADILLWPKWATIDLGGGGGSNSDGDIKLKTKDGAPRVHFDAGGGGPKNPAANRIYLDGSTSSATFSDGGGTSRARIDGQAGTLELLARDDAGLRLDGSSGTVEFDRTAYAGDADYAPPMLCLFGPDVFDLDNGPTVPVVSYSTAAPRRGLVYDDENDVFVFQEDDPPLPEIPTTGVSIGDGLTDGGTAVDDEDPDPVLSVDLPNGRVGVGTDSPEAPLDVKGRVEATKFESVSDARAKTNVEPITGAVDAVTRLDGVSYEWADGIGPDDDGRQLGLVADEVESVVPEVVGRNGESGLRSLAQGDLVAVLIEAIKEQQAELEEKEARIEKQAERLDEQAERLAALERRLGADGADGASE
jgi:hypothetical protein